MISLFIKGGSYWFYNHSRCITSFCTWWFVLTADWHWRGCTPVSQLRYRPALLFMLCCGLHSRTGCYLHKDKISNSVEEWPSLKNQEQEASKEPFHIKLCRKSHIIALVTVFRYFTWVFPLQMQSTNILWNFTSFISILSVVSLLLQSLSAHVYLCPPFWLYIHTQLCKVEEMFQ